MSKAPPSRIRKCVLMLQYWATERLGRYEATARRRPGPPGPYVSLTDMGVRPAYAFVECGAATRDSDGGKLPLPKCGHTLEQTAFREIVERLQGRIYSIGFALLGSASEADVAAQTALVRLYRTPRLLERQQDQIHCAYRLAVDQCLVEWRQRRARKLFAWLTLKKAESLPDRDRLLATDESRKQALALHCLAMLSERQRALLVLREVAGQPVEDIAKIMKMDSGAVRNGLFSARQRLLNVVLAVDKEAASP